MDPMVHSSFQTRFHEGLPFEFASAFHACYRDASSSRSTESIGLSNVIKCEAFVIESDSNNPNHPNGSNRNAGDSESTGAKSDFRVSKLMADRGLCSRREADSWIEKGWVKVNGKLASLGERAAENATIEIAPDARREREAKVTIIMNKPIGYVSGQPEPGYEPAVRLITSENQVYERGDSKLHRSHLDKLAPAGRLDIDSKGLLVFTQDGRIARQLIGEDSDIEKEYIVRVLGSIVRDGLKLLNHGLSLDDEPLRPAHVEWINNDQLRFVLKQGKKRQVRRMCELVGLRVSSLKRVRIGQIRLGDLPDGKWRYLRPDETF